MTLTAIQEIERSLFNATQQFWPEVQIRPTLYPLIDPAVGDLSTIYCQLVAQATRCHPNEIGSRLIEKLLPSPHTFELVEGYLNIRLGSCSQIIRHGEGCAATFPSTVVIAPRNAQI